MSSRGCSWTRSGHPEPVEQGRYDGAAAQEHVLAVVDVEVAAAERVGQPAERAARASSRTTPGRRRRSRSAAVMPASPPPTTATRPVTRGRPASARAATPAFSARTATAGRRRPASGRLRSGRAAAGRSRPSPCSRRRFAGPAAGPAEGPRRTSRGPVSRVPDEGGQRRHPSSTQPSGRVEASVDAEPFEILARQVDPAVERSSRMSRRMLVCCSAMPSASA